MVPPDPVGQRVGRCHRRAEQRRRDCLSHARPDADGRKGDRACHPEDPRDEGHRHFGAAEAEGDQKRRALDCVRAARAVRGRLREIGAQDVLGDPPCCEECAIPGRTASCVSDLGSRSQKAATSANAAIASHSQRRVDDGQVPGRSWRWGCAGPCNCRASGVTAATAFVVFILRRGSRLLRYPVEKVLRAVLTGQAE